MSDSELPIARRIEAADVQIGRMLVRASAALYPREEASFVDLRGGYYATGGESIAAEVVGMGLDGPVSDGELDRLMELLSARPAGASLRVASTAEPTLLPRLLMRGFSPVGTELCLARAVVLADKHAAATSGFSIQGLLPSRTTLWVSTVARALSGGREPPMDLERALRVSAAAEGFIGFFVVLGNEVIGAGGMMCVADIASLFAHATNEYARRRGVQQALFRHSLAICADRGIDWAKLNVPPETATARNALRAGFTEVGTRTVLSGPTRSR